MSVRMRVVAQGQLDGAARAHARRDRDPRVRAWALVREPQPERARAAARDRAEPLRIAAAHTTEDPDVLATLLADRSWRVRLAAVLAAERVRSIQLVPPLIEALAKSEGRVQRRCVKTLESLTGASPGDRAPAWRAWWKRAAAHAKVQPVLQVLGKLTIADIFLIALYITLTKNINYTTIETT